MFTFTADFARIDPRIQRAIYTSLEFLRVADQKLEMAVDAFDEDAVRERRHQRRLEALLREEGELQAAIASDDEDGVEVLKYRIKSMKTSIEDGDDDLDTDHIEEAWCVARTFVRIFQEFATGVPSVSDRVFRQVSEWVNKDDDNTPHTEAASLAMNMALHFILEAIDLDCEIEDGASEACNELLWTAKIAVEMSTSMLEDRGFYWQLGDTIEEILEADKKGQPLVSASA